MLMKTRLDIHSPRLVNGRGYVATVYLGSQPFVSLLPVANCVDSVVDAAWLVSHLARGMLDTLAPLSCLPDQLSEKHE